MTFGLGGASQIFEENHWSELRRRKIHRASGALYSPNGWCAGHRTPNLPTSWPSPHLEAENAEYPRTLVLTTASQVRNRGRRRRCTARAPRRVPGCAGLAYTHRGVPGFAANQPECGARPGPQHVIGCVQRHPASRTPAHNARSDPRASSFEKKLTRSNTAVRVVRRMSP